MDKYNNKHNNEKNNKYNYVIYHRGCYDGFSAFTILDKSGLIEKNAVIFPDVPSAKFAPRGVEDKDVIIMDTAYKYDILSNGDYSFFNSLMVYLGNKLPVIQLINYTYPFP